jgi:hypothetical protein
MPRHFLTVHSMRRPYILLFLLRNPNVGSPTVCGIVPEGDLPERNRGLALPLAALTCTPGTARQGRCATHAVRCKCRGLSWRAVTLGQACVSTGSTTRLCLGAEREAARSQPVLVIAQGKMLVNRVESSASSTLCWV